MTREAPNDGGFDAEAAFRDVADPGDPGRFGDLAMYVASGGARVAKASAYVTGGGLVAVYGDNVNVDRPESRNTGFESEDHSAPVEVTFPDLPHGSAHGHASNEAGEPHHPPAPAQADFITIGDPHRYQDSISRFADYTESPSSQGGHAPVPAITPGTPQAPAHVAPVAPAPPPVSPLDHFGADLTHLTSHLTDQLDALLHHQAILPTADPIAGPMAANDTAGGITHGSVFDGVGNGAEYGTWVNGYAFGGAAVQSTVDVGLEIGFDSRGLHIDAYSQVNVTMQAGFEAGSNITVGNIGSQLDQYNHAATGTANYLPANSSVDPTNHAVDPIRTRLGATTQSGSPAPTPGASPVSGVVGPEPMPTWSGPGLGAVPAGVGTAPATSGPTAMHSAPTPPSPAAAAQPVTTTPLQTTIQPAAATHPIADLATPIAGAPLTAPAANVAAIFDTHRLLPAATPAAEQANLPTAPVVGGNASHSTHTPSPGDADPIGKFGSLLPKPDSAWGGHPTATRLPSPDAGSTPGHGPANAPGHNGTPIPPSHGSTLPSSTTGTLPSTPIDGTGPASTTKPTTDGGTTTKPATDSTSPKPATDGTTTKPPTDSTPSKPATDGTTTKPGTDGTTPKPATDGSTSTTPGHHGSPSPSHVDPDTGSRPTVVAPDHSQPAHSPASTGPGAELPSSHPPAQQPTPHPPVHQPEAPPPLPNTAVHPEVGPSPLLTNPPVHTPSIPAHIAPSSYATPDRHSVTAVSDDYRPTDEHGLSGGLWTGGFRAEEASMWHDHGPVTHDTGAHHVLPLSL